MTEKIEDTIRKILNFLHITTSDMMIVSFVQFVKFGIIGASNTIIGYLLNVFVLLFLEKYNV